MQVLKPFFRLLDTNGDSTGDKSAIGDYSSAEEIFYIQPEDGHTMLIARLLITVEDTNGMTAQEYGNLGSALTNGVKIRVQDDNGSQIDITNGNTIKHNSEFAAYMFDVDIKTWGAGDELLTARFTFSKSGSPIRLEGSKNERLEIVFNDDMTGLIDHKFMVQGVYETKMI